MTKYSATGFPRLARARPSPRGSGGSSGGRCRNARTPAPPGAPREPRPRSGSFGACSRPRCGSCGRRTSTRCLGRLPPRHCVLGTEVPRCCPASPLLSEDPVLTLTVRHFSNDLGWGGTRRAFAFWRVLGGKQHKSQRAVSYTLEVLAPAVRTGRGRARAACAAGRRRAHVGTHADVGTHPDVGTHSDVRTRGARVHVRGA